MIVNKTYLRFFRERKKTEDLKTIVLKWIQDLCPNLQITENTLEWVHCVGHKQQQPRGIIIRFAFYTAKVAVHGALNKVEDLSCQGEKIEVYQDLAVETIQKRKEWRLFLQKHFGTKK